MIHFLILILVLAGAAVYFMTTDERARLFRVILQGLHDGRDALTLQGVECDEFFDTLRARNRRVIVAPALIALNALVFALTLFRSAPTNGQWWHPVMNPFTPAGFLDFVVSAACLLQIALILERLIGWLAFTAIFVAAGLAAGIVNLTIPPEGVTVGSSGSVLALYGVLLITSAWSSVRPSAVSIPLNVIKRLLAVAGVFILFNLFTIGTWNISGFAALLCGIVGGIVMAREVSDRPPAIRRVAIAMASVVMVVTLSAYVAAALHQPAPHTADVGPAIERVIAVEAHTAGVYDHAVARFRKGRINTKALADIIEQTIVPDLHAAAVRLQTLQDVPPEHQPLVATAEAFLKLRDESWRLRAEALHKSDSAALRVADRKEQDSLEAFHKVKTPASLQ